MPKAGKGPAMSEMLEESLYNLMHSEPDQNKKFGYKKIKDEIMRAFSVDCTQDNSKHKEAFKDTLENLISQGRVKKTKASFCLSDAAYNEYASEGEDEGEQGGSSPASVPVKKTPMKKKST